MTLWIEINGRARKVELPSSTASNASGELICLIDGRPLKFNVSTLAPGLLSLLVPDPTAASRQYQCRLDPSPEGLAVIINGRRIPFAVDDPRSLRARRGAASGTDGPRAVKAPMPGRVIRVLVAAGDQVAAHQGLIVIEAMKMQNELKSPKAGRIARIAAQPGDTVQSGDILIVVE
jgi:biotin carboxyl carrier protein